MRTLIATSFISLDGVVEAPGGEEGYRNTGWTMNSVEFDPAAYELKGTEQGEASAMLLGRKSYESFSAVWPSMTEEFPQYNAMPKYVLSTTLQEKDLGDNWGRDQYLAFSSRRGQASRRRRWSHQYPRLRDHGAFLAGTPAHRPVQPSGLPSSTRRRQEPVQPVRPGSAEARTRGLRCLPQRYPEERLQGPAVARQS